MKILRDFNAKVGGEEIFKPINVSESLLETNKDNGVRAVNSATSKNLSVKRTFPNRDIHKHIWTNPDGVTHNQIMF
jgi:hypothetical protein